jgi:hypothetical protein
MDAGWKTDRHCLDAGRVSIALQARAGRRGLFPFVEGQPWWWRWWRAWAVRAAARREEGT